MPTNYLTLQRRKDRTQHIGTIKRDIRLNLLLVIHQCRLQRIGSYRTRIGKIEADNKDLMFQTLTKSRKL